MTKNRYGESMETFFVDVLCVKRRVSYKELVACTVGGYSHFESLFSLLYHLSHYSPYLYDSIATYEPTNIRWLKLTLIILHSFDYCLKLIPLLQNRYTEKVPKNLLQHFKFLAVKLPTEKPVPLHLCVSLWKLPPIIRKRRRVGCSGQERSRKRACRSEIWKKGGGQTYFRLLFDIKKVWEDYSDKFQAQTGTYFGFLSLNYPPAFKDFFINTLQIKERLDVPQLLAALKDLSSVNSNDITLVHGVS